jgi:toxin ParE1/3/4
MAPRARTDLSAIGRYTKNQWGADQADRYLAELERAFELLGANPRLGRPAEHLRKGMRRMESGSHVIFYEIDDGDVLIGRVLHKSMEMKRRML